VFELLLFLGKYEGVSESFRTESITKNTHTLTFGISRREAIQRVMATKLPRLTHKIAIQLCLVAESRTICSSHPSGQSGNSSIHLGTVLEFITVVLIIARFSAAPCMTPMSMFCLVC